MDMRCCFSLVSGKASKITKKQKDYSSIALMLIDWPLYWKTNRIEEQELKQSMSLPLQLRKPEGFHRIHVGSECSSTEMQSLSNHTSRGYDQKSFL